jgi:hypothetical protein
MRNWMYRYTFFLTSALVGGELSVSSFNPGERAPGSHWVGSWMDPQYRSGQHGEEKIMLLPELGTATSRSSSP